MKCCVCVCVSVVAHMPNTCKWRAACTPKEKKVERWTTPSMGGLMGLLDTKNTAQDFAKGCGLAWHVPITTPIESHTIRLEWAKQAFLSLLYSKGGLSMKNPW